MNVHAKRTNAESGRTVSRGASDVHWGSLDSGANLTRPTRTSPYDSEHTPPARVRRAVRAERARAAGCLYSHTVKLAKAMIPPIIMAARTSVVVTASQNHAS